ncbi:response regulator transcription factor [Saccharothrix obliqua]|uniref:response regulator transcription factor n=1 Tax=Saccharothrix obliqua TaxID=2861747 RepID=UPI001C5E72F3|nr:response regulator transcription factor [Saccharothrix obliqua]MBW4722354.1 response regulator transcription factor [Saccharothrix obliqua]
MQILLVEEQEGATHSPASELQRYGHDITTVGTGAVALEVYEDADIVLLDINLPDIDGLEVCRRIRAAGDKPIIAFARRGAELDRVLGLQAGADDCLDKPYGVRELQARIEAVMRRIERGGSRCARLKCPETGKLSIGSLCIDPVSREVKLNGGPVQLTRKEFDLLFYLAERSDTVVTRPRLMLEIWHDTTPHALNSRASRTIDTHVSSLRGKLGREWIRTVRGVGFRLSPPHVRVRSMSRARD